MQNKFLIFFILVGIASISGQTLTQTSDEFQYLQTKLNLQNNPSGTSQIQFKSSLMSLRNFRGDDFSQKFLKDKRFYDGAILSDGTTWRDNSDVSSTKLYSIFGVIALADALGYLKLKEMWYKNETTKFHAIDFHADGLKYQLMDKYGHGLHAYFVSDLTTKAYRWAGVSGNESILYGSLTGWLWMLQIEVMDGFFADWGFSWGDLLANTAGAGFSALNQIYPDEFGGLQPKFSYHTSDALKNHLYNNGATNPVDDYEGLTFWLGVNPYHYLPSSIKEAVPVWLRPLGVAVGYSAEGIANSPQGGRREIFIGLDIDLRQINVGESNFLKFLLTELNFVRLPLPAVRLTPTGIWYGLYF
ncbi:MAG: DUF2279 domain-containing protein [Ignavibacteriales bacterium]|nr:MAG: DUF2279 domain-containing protein [Ignavibacteriales bacterium]